MQISARVEEHVPRPPEQVFDFATACETFPKVLIPLGPVAGIAHADLLDGDRLRTGARRRIVLTDGSIIDEEVLTFERPSRHRYRWLNPPPAPFAWIVRGGEGDWTFTSFRDGTTITWTYRFELTSPVVYPLAALVIGLFRRWMARGLANVRTQLMA